MNVHVRSAKEMLRSILLVLTCTVCIFSVAACGGTPSGTAGENNRDTIDENKDTNSSSSSDISDNVISLTTTVKQLENGLSAVRFDGAYYFEEFLRSGGASSDSDVVGFLSGKLSAGLVFEGNPFGCSTLAVPGENGAIFGRNFDWYTCDALIVESHAEGQYASISTVNTNFISGINFQSLPDRAKAIIALYAPLDGMNEKGLAVSVNMISDGRNINQNTEKADLTTTTAIRLILNQAANVNEAVELLHNYDLHASMGYMVHFTIADNEGHAVCVEYINNRMTVTESKVVTNFYLSDNAQTAPDYTQAHLRYDTLMERVNSKQVFNANDVKEALSAVSRNNYGGSESSEWSVLYELGTGRVTYYHRENFGKGYRFVL